MIKCKNGKAILEGNSFELMVDLGTIMRGCIEALDIPKEVMLKMVDASYKTDEELAKENAEFIEDIEEKMDLLDDLTEEDKEFLNLIKSKYFKSKNEGDNTFSDIFGDLL